MKKSFLTFMAVFFAFSFPAAGTEVQTLLLATGQNAGDVSAVLIDAELSGSGYPFSGGDNTIRLEFSGKGRIDPAESVNEYALGAELLFSHMAGQNSIGTQLAGSASQSQFSGTDTVSAGLSFPVTLNSELVSLHVSPFLEINPLADGYTASGFRSYFSFLAGEFVIKPGLDGSYSWERDGSRVFSASPGLKVSWYPGFPISTGFSTEYRYEGDTAAADGRSLYAFAFFFAVSPANWLLLSGETVLSLDGGSFSSGSALESSFYVLRKKDKTLSVPLRLAYSSGPVQAGEISAGLRFSF